MSELDINDVERVFKIDPDEDPEKAIRFTRGNPARHAKKSLTQ
jgi:hypothetical protein